MKTVGIVGGSGYTGGELIRLIINHPKLEIKFIYSTQFCGDHLSKVHKDLLGITKLKFTNIPEKDIDVLFLCAGHGNSLNFLKKNKFSSKTKIIDLSNDFRIIKNNEFNGYKFIYGLPELNKEKIKSAKAVSNPGCFATAIQLSLIPLAKQDLIKNTVKDATAVNEVALAALEVIDIFISYKYLQFEEPNHLHQKSQKIDRLFHLH